MDEYMNVALCCMVTKDMPEYFLSDINELTIEKIMSRKNNKFCEKCIQSKTCSSIRNTPSYKGEYVEQTIEGLSKIKQRIVVVGDDAVTKSFHHFFSGVIDYVRVGNIHEVDLEKSFIVLANKMWWRDRAFLEENNKEENKNFYIYNLYLR